MPITYHWDTTLPDQAGTPLHLFITTFTDPWTWEEMRTSNEQTAVPMMQSVDGPIYGISDFRNSKQLPLGDGFSHVRAVLRTFPANWSLTVCVSSGILIRSMVNTFRRLHVNDFASRFYGVETMEQARDLILRQVAKHAAAEAAKQTTSARSTAS